MKKEISRKGYFSFNLNHNQHHEGNKGKLDMLCKPVMKFARILLILIFLSSIAMTTIDVQAAPMGQEPPPPVQPQSFDLEKLDVSIHDQTGKVRFLATSPAEPILISAVVASGGEITAEDAARAFLGEHGDLFGLRDASGELTLMTEVSDETQRSFERFQQVYQGVPVLGGELVVQLDEGKNIISVNGEILPELDDEILVYEISPEAALETALNVAAKKYEMDTDQLSATDPSLWIYSPKLFASMEGPTQLVWQVEVTTHAEVSAFREMVLVGAQRGEVVLNFNQQPDAKVIKVYDAQHTTTYEKSTACTKTNCADGDADEYTAWLYSNQTYDFYKNYHNRDSYNNAGATIKNSVHYGVDYENAFWNGSYLVFGDNMVSDDVLAHEYTHAVTDFTSQLFYYAQSGAINESMSDLWGEFIDLTNGYGNDTAGVRWLIGEDLSIGTLRSMTNPTAYGDPDKMSSSNFYLGLSDNAGVHWNNGVGNKAVSLLTDGGSFNGYTITGLGIAKVAAIYYDVQTKYLVSGSDYQDLGDTLYFACRNMIGRTPYNSTIITNDDCQQVYNTTHAVEMHLPARNLSSQADAPYCDNGVTTPVDIRFNETFEGGLNNWIATNSAWGWDTSLKYSWLNAHSGLHFAYGDDVALDTNSALQMKNAITLPANAYLHFYHSYDLENGWDGGVVEYSTDGGVTWTDASSLFVNNGYTGYVNSMSRNGFTGSNYGYHASRLNLSSLAGQSVRFRWRLQTDPISGVRWGWWLDDVKIYTCTPPNVEVSINQLLRGSYIVPVDGRITPRYWENGGLTGPGLQAGPVKVTSPTSEDFFTSERVHFPGTDSSKWTAFNEVMGLPTERLSTEYYFTWYDNLTMYTWVLVGNPSETQTAEVDIYIGGTLRGHYSIQPGQRVTPRYWENGGTTGPGLQAGPVRVVSTNGVKIFASERTHFTTPPWTGFNEVLGYPVEDLDTQYWFPWYDNQNMLTWVLVGNPSTTQTAEVDIYIDNLNRGHYSIPPGGKVTPRFFENGGYTGPGLVAGPVIVDSLNGVPIFASERVHYPAGTWKDFNEVMGVPLKRIGTSYMFTWYDSKTMIADIMVGNSSVYDSANVSIYIAGNLIESFTINPLKTVTKRYSNIQNGPVKVISTNGVPIVTSERVQYKNSTAASYTGFNELMGFPEGDLSDEYWFTWYDNSTMVNWVLVGR